MFGTHPSRSHYYTDPMAHVLTIDTPSLGDRSYLAHDGTCAIVVDPQRDIDRVTALAAKHGVRITHIFETHIHNDYVTGGFALAQETGAAYHVNAADPVAFDRVETRDGDLVEVSDLMAVRAVSTPGHTFTHLSFELHSRESTDAEFTVQAVFTGGSMLFGATGRPDLLGPDHTDALVNHQYDSVRKLADSLPGDAEVLPTHGFGSFCSAGSTGGSTESTIGHERTNNPALQLDRDEWVARTLASLDTYPSYYAHMGPANSDGPAAPDLSEPRRAHKDDIQSSIEAGDWVVDLRTRTAFADGHVIGSYNVGVDGQFSTYVGWLMPWGTSLTLLGETPEQIEQAQRELVRIGIERVDAAATGKPVDWTDGDLGLYPCSTFADLLQVRHHRQVSILDVRQQSEAAAGHIEGSVNIPVNDIITRLDEVPTGEVWVHCAAGYRASIAASVLAANSRQVVLIDDCFSQASEAGLPIVTDE